MTIAVRLDGGAGAHLLAQGIAPARAPLDAPEAVRRLHHGHLDAGARALTTVSFAAGGERDLARIAFAAVSLAREVGGELPVYGSVGPMGDVRGLARALLGAGCDALLLETFLDVDALVQLVAELSSEGAVFASMCPLQSDASAATRLGERLVGAGASAVGAGCGDGIASVESAALAMSETVEVPVFARPSAGVPRDGVYPLGARELAASAERLRAAGIIVGGCCGVDAARLAAMHAGDDRG